MSRCCFTSIRPEGLGSVFLILPETSVFLLSSVWGLWASTAAVLTVVPSSEGFSALLKGISDIRKKRVSHSLTLRSPETQTSFLNVDVMKHITQIYSASHPADNSFASVIRHNGTRENLNTILQSRSSSRFPDSSCNPDSREERETWLLQTVPTGGCAKEQQQSIKHAVKTSSAVLLLCSLSSPRI